MIPAGLIPHASTLLAEGYVSRADAIAEVRYVASDPFASSSRAIHVRTLGGLSVEILPERGLDLGSVWWCGYPIAWRSALGPRGASSDPASSGWIGRFEGGMLATCGVDNIGPARDGLGLHGSHHLTSAFDVAVTRDRDHAVTITGTVDSSSVFGRCVEVRRRIRLDADVPRVTVRDMIINLGTTPAPTPVLYHLNFGAPFLMPATAIEVDAEQTLARDALTGGADWMSYPEPTDEVREYVWEHSGIVPDAAGGSSVAIRSSSLPATAVVSWRAEELPRCVQWVYPARRGWALGIEPTNAPIFGPARDHPDAGAPILEPGEARSSGFTLELRPT
ncbi:DUF4432 family protein [Demequina sp.]|uniref:DUF4432 family protein n=1 Tax=Demequina sp. TaxID=2050685 RepID=UPI003A8B400F